ncbi:MAG TPA: hypothetical protein VFI95_06280 [Terriglobales bacterium]|nr:hypothetical protein [Terriglobales bacterium]
MKRMVYGFAVLLFAGFLSTALLAQNQNDDLGKVARQNRKEKQAPTKVYDNDNLPAQEHISVVGKPSSSSDSSQAPDSNASNDDSAKSAADHDKAKLTVDPDDSPEERQKVYDEWHKKIADQKDTVNLLQRELDVLQREYRLRAAAMYADVGNRLRNSGAWDKEDRDYKDKVAAKQKELDGAKQQLSDFQDDARKAGVPAKFLE